MFLSYFHFWKCHPEEFLLYCKLLQCHPEEFLLYCKLLQCHPEEFLLYCKFLQSLLLIPVISHWRQLKGQGKTFVLLNWCGLDAFHKHNDT